MRRGRSGPVHEAAALERLRGARGFVLDLDGTLVLGDRRNEGLRPLPGAIELLQWLRARGLPFVALTNGTARTPAAQAAKLAAAGLAIDPDRLLTPSVVAADHFVRQGFERVLVLGVEGVWQPLREAGLEVLRPAVEGGDALPEVDAVYAGWYREFHLAEIEAACEAVRRGTPLYVASQIPYFAVAGGRALGSSRLIAAMIRSITGRRATVLGKPSGHALRCAARRLQCSVAELAVVGDDPELEAAMARRYGALAVLVGERRREVAEAAHQRPDLSVSGVDALLPLLE